MLLQMEDILLHPPLSLTPTFVGSFPQCIPSREKRKTGKISPLGVSTKCKERIHAFARVCVDRRSSLELAPTGPGLAMGRPGPIEKKEERSQNGLIFNSENLLRFANQVWERE